MTRSKLTDVHKQEIVQVFRDTPTTIAELAQRYGVSSSTIRRTLKQQLSNAEYDQLVAAKQDRGPSRTKRNPSQPVLKAKRSTPELNSMDAVALQATNPPEGYELDPAKLGMNPKEDSFQEPVASPPDASDPAFVQMLAEIEHDLDDNDIDADDDDIDVDDEDDIDVDDDEDDIDAEDGASPVLELSADQVIDIFPFTDASIPVPCFVVIDRSAELITCPLKSFGELGKIPDAESQSKTLPVFENHRVARRFSHRSQRIIKVPNGNMLRKAEAHLQAKGITRLLIKGRVYSL